MQNPCPRRAVVSGIAIAGLIATTLTLGQLVPTASPAQAVTGDSPEIIPELTTSTSVTYDLPQGGRQLVAYTTPVNYQDEDGEWHVISNDLVEVPGEQYLARNEANSFTASIPSDPASTPVKLESSDGWISMRMHGVEGQAEIDEATATFDEVADASEVTYTSTSQGIKEDIVLEEAPGSPVAYTYTIQVSDGLKPRTEPDHSISFVSDDGTATFNVPAGMMYDSAELPVSSDAVQYKLAAVDPQTWRLTVTPSYEWLADPSRVYPVIVDPTLNNQQPSRDCTIRSASPTQSSCGNNAPYIRVGRQDANTRFRGLLDFDLSAVPDTATVTDATIGLYLDSTQSYSSLGADYSLIRAGKAFNGNATWNSSGANGAWDAGDPTGSAISTLSLTGAGTGYRNFDGMANAFDGFVKSPGTWKGLVLKQTADATANVLGFFSSSTASTNDGRRPKLTLTYDRAPSTPSDLRALDDDPLSAIVADPDAGTVRAAFEIRDGSTTVWSATSQAVASGSRASVAVPFDQLQLAKRYTVRVRAYDGRNYSSYLTGTLVTDPEAVLAADIERMAKSAFGRDAAIWTNGSSAIAGSEIDVKSDLKSGLEANGLASDDASQVTTASTSAISSHMQAVLTQQSLVAEESVTISSSTAATTIKTSRRDSDVAATVLIDNEVHQVLADDSSGSGQKYVDDLGNYTSMDSYLGAGEDADSPSEEAESSWTDSYRVSFALTANRVTGVDGQLHVASWTPALTSIEMLEGAEFRSSSTFGDGQAPPVAPPASEAASTVRPATAAVPLPARVAQRDVSYKHIAAARYAREWTAGDKLNELNHDYPHENEEQEDGGPSNCANFVSQALYEGGGWPTEGNILDTPKSTDAWDWDLPVVGVGPTYTWMNARWLYYYEHEEKNLDWIRNMYQAVKGETLFWDWDGDGEIDHANIVTGRTKSGMPRISQKSTGRHNVLLRWWFKTVVLPEHPNARVWGLHYYED